MFIVMAPICPDRNMEMQTVNNIVLVVPLRWHLLVADDSSGDELTELPRRRRKKERNSLVENSPAKQTLSASDDSGWQSLAK